ncbi:MULTISPECIES: acyltransferase [unclassified Nostoc]|uniref:acyltransferase family protein n=1 Tax=unclassified Nostoc TaxID=2593658 RepID=UPI002AD44041|nr:acyltransferase [Nostoc sp. DedQUE03]MDZ7973524.1 acyltransferase [Nostoc sp. DedQUE03]MDZ8047237.1 acyltransferase [Nostoc sp. DedQUE02]
MKILQPAPENSRVIKYMKQLDGLRAIAVFSVLYTHYLPAPYWLFGIYWGKFGVKLFFVLSGFLITSILLKCRKEITSRQKTLSSTLYRFYIRRFLRLFPLFYLIIAITAIVNIPPVRETIGWHISYLSNIYFAIKGSFDGSISHFWSLAVEEQFYLLWPWFILFSSKKLLLPILVLIILVGPLFRLLATHIGLNEVAVWVLTPSVLDILGLGSLLAYLKHRKEIFNISQEKIVKVFFIIGIILLLLGKIFKRIDNNIIFEIVFSDTALALIFTWLVAEASIGFKGIVGSILESQPLVYLGKISYGIYLIHLFTLYEVSKVFQKLELSFSGSAIVIAIFSTIATIIIASVSWHFLEKPIIELKRFFNYTDKQPI